VPDDVILGIVALSKGDWAGALALCRPFCKLDVRQLEQLTQLLPGVQKMVKLASDPNNAMKAGLEGMGKVSGLAASRMQQITGKLAGGKGDSGDLFALTDVDGNGKINMEEFNMCTVRLGYKLNPSRVNEIFSKCKKDLGAQELNEQEFKDALDYLQTRVATTSHQLLGKSWPTLMALLTMQTIMLFLLICFIFLGMTAFTQGGGAFNSIINSAMTLVAGAGMFKKGHGQKNESEEQKKTADVVMEEHDTVFNDQ